MTEPLKPFLHAILVSATLHVYVSQTDRGEVLIGSEIEPYTSYAQDSTLDFLEVTAAHTLELLPILSRVKVMRAWGGLCDVSPDYSPIMGTDRGRGVPDRRRVGDLRVQGDADRGRHDGRPGPRPATVPELIAPFALERFWRRELVSEIAAAAVSH